MLFYLQECDMASSDQKSPKRPKHVTTVIKTKKGSIPSSKAVFEFKSGVSSEGLEGSTLHLYQLRTTGSTRKELLAEKLTAEFEKLLATATEATLREAIESLQALQQKKPSSAPSMLSRFLVLHRTSNGKFVVANESSKTNPTVKAVARILYGAGSGTGSTGPGKPKVKK